MREIIFRGKSKKNGRWIYGSLVKLDISENNKHLLGDCRCYIKDNDDKTGNRLVSNNYTDWRCYDVDPETVGQFTGLHDKNGEEIFEGDIVRVFDPDKNHQIQTVVFKDGAFCGYSDKKTCKYTFLEILIKANGIEVIGNVFEDGDLLG